MSQSGYTNRLTTPAKSVKSFNGEDRESTADESAMKDKGEPGSLKYEMKEKFPEIYELAMAQSEESIFWFRLKTWLIRSEKDFEAFNSRKTGIL